MREKPKIPNIELGKKLGRGVEKHVYENANNPDKVVMVYDRGFGIKAFPEVPRARFYLMNILNLLYPKVFRHIDIATAQSENILEYFITDNIELGPIHKRILELNEKINENHRDELVRQEREKLTNAIRKNPQYKRFLEILEEVGMYVSSGGVDANITNFAQNQKGEMMYIDTIDPFGPEPIAGQIYLRFNDEVLKSRILQNLKGDEQSRALDYLKRIEQLLGEVNSRLAEKNKKYSD